MRPVFRKPIVSDRLTLLVDEAFRHGKAVAVLGDEEAAGLLGLTGSEPGVVVGDAEAVGAGVVDALSRHRAWERFTPAS